MAKKQTGSGKNAPRKSVCVISNTHCDAATSEIISFCGIDNVDKVDAKLADAIGKGKKGVTVRFDKKGSHYWIYKGLNGTMQPGRYTYNVYKDLQK